MLFNTWCTVCHHLTALYSMFSSYLKVYTSWQPTWSREPQIKCWSHDLQIFLLKFGTEKLAPVKGIILTGCTFNSLSGGGGGGKGLISLKPDWKKPFKVTQTTFPIRKFREVNRKPMCLEDLLNNELRIRPPFPTYCIDSSPSENEFFFKVHLACYFWNICNNKLPLGKQIRI